MNSNPRPTFLQSLWACIVQLVLIVPVTVVFTLIAFFLIQPISKVVVNLLSAFGDDGMQLLASILMVAAYGCILVLSKSNWLVSLKNILVAKIQTISSKVISYFLFMLYLIPVGILFILIIIFFGIVRAIETKFDWLYYGILLSGVILITFLIDKKQKTINENEQLE